ncbi:MAG: PKD domain-containing protein [Gammaproteobacteria bacterium]|nr:MAG: PKD domain-containing protein [Gammaproteobacteria bacterium]
MKKISLTKFSFLKIIVALVTAAMCTLPLLAQQAFALSPLGPLRVHDGKLMDSYGKPFIFRGVTIDHTLAPEKTLQAIRDIAAAGANSAQIELPLYPDAQFYPRPIVAQVREIIAECKANKLICVLEPNDVAGYPFHTTIGSDLLTFWTWPDMLSVLYGNQAYIIIGLGNQHFGDDTFKEYEYRMPAYAESLINALPGGYVVMIDGNDWSEDTSKLMFNFAKSLKDQASVLSQRLIYSVDMFYSYQDPTRVHDYIAAFNEIGAPLIIGGFAPVPYYHPNRPTPLNQDAPQIPVASVMQYAEQYGAGYFGWSWSGNKNSFSDVVTNYDSSTLTDWGNLLFNDTNGIKATAKLAAIYDNVSSSSSSSAPNRPPLGDFNLEITPQCGANPLYWTLNAKVTSLSDPDGHSMSYRWSRSDGNETGSTTYFSFRATVNTSYTVTLKVTDSWGASTSVTKTIAPSSASCTSSSSSSVDISSASSSSSYTRPSSSKSSSSVSSSRSSSSRPISSISSISSSSSSSAQTNRPPIANFNVYNYPSIFCGSPNAGQGRVTAEAAGSSDPDGDPLTYFWSFSGGGTASGYTATFTSRSGSSYQLTLTVTDNHGASTSLVRNVPVFYLDCFSSASSISSSSSSIPSSSSSSSSVKSSASSSSSSRSSSSSSKTSSSSSISSNGKAQCSYVIQSQWGNGFTAAIRVKNVSTQPINGWSLTWKYADTSKVTNLWNANLSGTNPYTATNLNWNATIQPGQTLEFGFQGSKPTGNAVAPSVTGSICQ